MVISYMADGAATLDLAHLLDDSDPEIAEAATEALSGMPNISEADRGTAKDALLRGTKSTDHFIRGHAYAGLIHVDPQGSLPMLKDVLRKDALSRSDIFYSVIRNHVMEAVPLLEEFIRDNEKSGSNDSDDRAVAAQAIYKLTGKRVPYKGLEQQMKLYKDPYERQQ